MSGSQHKQTTCSDYDEQAVSDYKLFMECRTVASSRISRKAMPQDGNRALSERSLSEQLIASCLPAKFLHAFCSDPNQKDAVRKNKKGPYGPCVRLIKRLCPARVRLPALPQPGAAVLSATAGLTSEFGTGSGVSPPPWSHPRGARAFCPGRSRAPWRLHAGPTGDRSALRAQSFGREELGLLVALG